MLEFLPELLRNLAFALGIAVTVFSAIFLLFVAATLMDKLLKWLGII